MQGTLRSNSASASSEILEVDQNTPETSQRIEPPWEHEWPLTAESPKTPLKEGDRGSWPLEERTLRLEMEEGEDEEVDSWPPSEDEAQDFEQFSDDEAYHCSLTPFIGKGNSSKGGGIPNSEGGKILDKSDTKVDTQSSDINLMNKVTSDKGEGREGGEKEEEGEDGRGEGGEGGEGGEEGEGGEGGGYDLDDIDAVLNEDKPKTLFSEGGLLEEIR
ncbi:spore wall protein 2 [Eurytemora carolleeae]|uniref:spore wall protein 2 n=1 Tax=Eurytemora carolleeae TaxID=1294199 RepID=UPI000C7947F6|nr:spore wall protein 2 [Eurytemora carolleeae]|eukprot:XP_023341395.1 spore wall protein 2-like [Eurytemora affinis]